MSHGPSPFPQVNTFPSALEVLGAPLTGSDVRAYVMSGGGIRMKGLTPKFSTKRAYLIFPVRGPERRGLVSVEAKKRHGKVRGTGPGRAGLAGGGDRPLRLSSHRSLQYRSLLSLERRIVEIVECSSVPTNPHSVV